MNISEQLRVLREGTVGIGPSIDDIIIEAFEDISLLESITGDYNFLDINLFENYSVLTESVDIIEKIFMKLFDKTNKLQKLLDDNDLSKYNGLSKDFHKYTTDTDVAITFNLTPSLLIERRKFIIEMIDSLPSVNKVLDAFKNGMSSAEVIQMVRALTNNINAIKEKVNYETGVTTGGQYSFTKMRKHEYIYTHKEIKTWRPEIVTQNRAEFIKEVLDSQNKLKSMKSEIKNAISKVDNSNFINKSQVKGLLKKVVDVELYLYNMLIETLHIAFMEDMHVVKQVQDIVDQLKKK